jgi:integrase
MQDESLHGPASRVQVAPNVHRRTLKSGDVRYDVVFRDVGGRQRQKTLKARTERDAIKEARAVLAQRDGGDRVVGARVTLGDFADSDYLPTLDALVAAGRRAERGRDRYVYDFDRYVRPTFGGRRLGEIEARHLSELIRSMRLAGYAESSIHNALCPVRAMYRLARSRGLVTGSPFDGLDRSELPKPTGKPSERRLDERELDLFVAHATPTFRPVLTVLAFTGLRVSEALGLRWADVDFVDGELHVRTQLTPATKDRPARLTVRLKTEASERVVPMFPAVEAALQELLAVELASGRGRDGDLLFVTRTGGPMVHRNVARAVEDTCERAGIKRATPQNLRASFCSLAGRRNVDPVEAAQITGHTTAVWAKHYASSFGKAQRDEARRRMLEHGFGAEPAPAR